MADVENDLVIVEDGSGGLSFNDIRGNVENKPLAPKYANIFL